MFKSAFRHPLATNQLLITRLGELPAFVFKRIDAMYLGRQLDRCNIEFFIIQILCHQFAADKTIDHFLLDHLRVKHIGLEIFAQHLLQA